MFLIQRLKGLAGDPASLRTRALSAGIWSVGGMGASQAMRLAGNLVMTRILAPEAFGLMAMVVTVHIALTMLTDIGIRTSVVRSPRGEDAHFLRVAWSVQILRSALITLMVALTAGALALAAPCWAPAGTVYADPELPALIAASSLALLIKGFEPTTMFLAQRRMRLARLTALELGAQVVGLVAMVGFAQIEPSVWALLAGMLVGGVARLAASHVVFATPRMGFVWDREIVDELWKFGRWLIGSSLASYVANNADKLILGALLDKQSFGFYVIAILWVQVGVDVMHRLSGNVGFPAIAEILRSGGDFNRIFTRFRLVFEAISLVGFAVFLMAGAALIGLLYPPAYQVAGGYLALLAFRLLPMRYEPFWAFILGRGESLTIMLSTALHAATLILALAAAFNAFGLDGALLVVALSPLASAPLLLARSGRAGVRGLWRDWAMLAVIPGLFALVWRVW